MHFVFSLRFCPHHILLYVCKYSKIQNQPKFDFLFPRMTGKDSHLYEQGSLGRSDACHVHMEALGARTRFASLFSFVPQKGEWQSAM